MVQWWSKPLDNKQCLGHCACLSHANNPSSFAQWCLTSDQYHWCCLGSCRHNETSSHGSYLYRTVMFRNIEHGGGGIPEPPGRQYLQGNCELEACNADDFMCLCIFQVVAPSKKLHPLPSASDMIQLRRCAVVADDAEQ